MKFNHFRFLVDRLFEADAAGGAPRQRYQGVEPERLPPLVLAYIGDAFFSLFTRTRLLGFEQNKVQVLHTFDARMVSASMQAVACRALEPQLTEYEQGVLRRGRNARSTVPKSATVAEYRYSTGFEAVLGYLYLKEDYARLEELAEQAFVIIAQEMMKQQHKE